MGSRASRPPVVEATESATLASTRRHLQEPSVRELIGLDPGESFKWHTHDYPGPLCRWNHHPEYEIHLIAYGTGRFIVGDKIGRFSQGQVVLIGPHLPHNWISDMTGSETLKNQNIVIQFSADWIESCLGFLPELRSLRPVLQQATRGVEFLHGASRAAASLMGEMGLLEGVARLAAMFRLMGVFATASPADQRVLASHDVVPPQGINEDFIEHILQRLYSTPENPVTMGELARDAGMSISTFSRTFTRATGQGFSETARKLRITKACHLLENTDDPIARVAALSGFTNLSHFNRQFRREYGVTPSQYRKENIG